jgi:hypothetical protein
MTTPASVFPAMIPIWEFDKVLFESPVK